MERRMLFMTLLIAVSVSCQKSNKIQKKNNINLRDMEETQLDVLKSQLNKGYNAIIGDAVDYQNQYSEKDLTSENIILKKVLSQNGYKQLSNELFSEKINLIFSRKLDFNSGKAFVYLNTLNKCNRNTIYYQNNVIDYDGFFIFKNGNFIAPLYTIPEIIDYQKEFSNIQQYENRVPKEYKNENNDIIRIKKWDDNKYLTNKRHLNIMLIVNRNKYLFNDNNASFVWLQFNDKIFLESLVKTFGYVKDKKLLNFVLKNNYKNSDEFHKILWNERCNGEIVFNKEVLDIISESPEDKKELYLNAIADYLVKEKKNRESILNNNFSKKAEILGKLAYYSSKIGEPIGKYYNFFTLLNGGEYSYEEEFEKNNYYNIPDFKNVWEETKNGGVSLPGSE